MELIHTSPSLNKKLKLDSLRWCQESLIFSGYFCSAPTIVLWKLKRSYSSKGLESNNFQYEHNVNTGETDDPQTACKQQRFSRLSDFKNGDWASTFCGPGCFHCAISTFHPITYAKITQFKLNHPKVTQWSFKVQKRARIDRKPHKFNMLWRQISDRVAKHIR